MLTEGGDNGVEEMSDRVGELVRCVEKNDEAGSHGGRPAYLDMEEEEGRLILALSGGL